MKKPKWCICLALVCIGFIVTACTGRENTTNLELPQPVSSESQNSHSALSEASNSEEACDTFEEAIETALYQKSSDYLPGEYFSSAYRILQTDEDEAGLTLYLLATHGWYCQDTEIEEVSGCGVRAGVLRLTHEGNGYSVEAYDEYEIKQLTGSLEGIFPDHVKEDTLINCDEYYVVMKDAEQKAAVEYFDNRN